MNSRTGHILIVDDDADICANISDILVEMGYQTETACDADVALKKMAGGDPESCCGYDLCLLDFKMPGMDGAELFERIHKECPTVPAIMITAYAGDNGVQKAIDAGTWKVLRKPVDIESLLGLIAEATS